MGLRDLLLGNKRDYAQEFKDAFLDTKLDKCADILSDWHEHTKYDANQDYAYAIMAAVLANTNNDKDLLKKAESLFDNPDSNCENSSLRNWFHTAAKVSIMKAKSEFDSD